MINTAHHQVPPRGRGFSLVEAAVVLVVIGLILAAVLQGRQLIASAEYKAFRSQLSESRNAFQTFRDRYDGLPGDFPAADARLEAGQTDGNGNGVIEDGPDCVNNTDESCTAWQHLRAAGLLGGNPATPGAAAAPDHTYGGKLASFFTGATGNVEFGHKILIEDVPVEVAIRLDREADDERCDAGRVAARSGCIGTDTDDWPSDATVDVIYAL